MIHLNIRENITHFKAWIIPETCLVDVATINFEESYIQPQQSNLTYDFSDIVLLQNTEVKDTNDQFIFEKDLIQDAHGHIGQVVKIPSGFAFNPIDDSNQYFHLNVYHSEYKAPYLRIGSSFEIDESTVNHSSLK